MTDLGFFVLDNVLTLTELLVHGHQFSFEGSNFSIQLLSLASHILEILLDLLQKLILILLLLHQVFIFALVCILLKNKRIKSCAEIMSSFLKLLGLGLILLYEVKQLILLRSEFCAFTLQVNQYSFFGSKLFLMIRSQSCDFSIFGLVGFFEGIQVSFIEVSELVIESLDLAVLLLVDLAVPHQLKVAIDLAQRSSLICASW